MDILMWLWFWLHRRAGAASQDLQLRCYRCTGLVCLLCSLKVADLQYNTLANGHGPIIRYNVEELVGNYKNWSLAVEKGSVQVGRAAIVAESHLCQ